VAPEGAIAMKYFVSFLFAMHFSFGLCESPPNAIITRPSASVIVIDGYIDSNASSRFEAVLDSAVKMVILNSEGGVTSEALKIGLSIHTYRLNVKVRGVCMSSCANYLFISGKRKSVARDSIVGWHGGHANNPFGAATSSDAIQFRRDLFNKEQRLYLITRAPIDLIVYSGFLTNRIKFADGSEEQEFNIWVPPQKVLQRMGLNGLESFWHPGSPSAVAKVLDKHGIKDALVYTGGLREHIPKLYR
jgi:hypothetical protein